MNTASLSARAANYIRLCVTDNDFGLSEEGEALRNQLAAELSAEKAVDALDALLRDRGALRSTLNGYNRYRAA